MTPAERDLAIASAGAFVRGATKRLQSAGECARAVLAFVPPGDVQAPADLAIERKGDVLAIRVVGTNIMLCVHGNADAERLAWALLAAIATARTHVPAPDKEG